MSEQLQALTDLVAYTAWGIAEDVSAPASNLALLDHQFTTARSRDLLSGRWTLDFAAATDVAALWLGGANFASVDVFGSTDGYTFSGLVSAQALDLCARDGRRQACIPLGAVGVVSLLLVAGALAPEHAADARFELGAAYPSRTVRQFKDYDAWPLRSLTVVPGTTLTDDDTGITLDTNEEGRPYVEWRIGNPNFDPRTGVESDVAALGALPPDEPFVLWVTTSAASEAYCVTRVDDVTVERTPGRLGAEFLFRECS